MVALLILEFFSTMCWTFKFPRTILHTFFVLKSVGMTWVCLLTAFLIQCLNRQAHVRLSRRRNRVGLSCSLNLWFYLCSTMIGLGVIFGYKEVRFWGMVRLGNALSTIPVSSALSAYNIHSTSLEQLRGREMSHGKPYVRGYIMAQTMMVYERLYFCLVLTAAIGDFNLNKQNNSGEDDFWWEFWKKLRSNNTEMAAWMRILIHTLFINMLDESSQLAANQSANLLMSESTCNQRSSTIPEMTPSSW